MTLRVVYDTNIMVSAALKPASLPASLVALAMARDVRLFLSPAILEEYEAVLKRPRFRLDPKGVEAFLRDLRKAAVMVWRRQRVSEAPDEADNRFLECALVARAGYLVTGNRKHFPFPTLSLLLQQLRLQPSGALVLSAPPPHHGPPPLLQGASG